jgi:hypothetical protein
MALNIIVSVSKMKKLFGYLMLLCTVLLMTGCGSSSGRPKESKEAKQLLQGIWVDEGTDEVLFKLQGDSVYYPDSTSMPAYFMVAADTLYIGSTSRFHIEKHAEHVLWIQNEEGELIKLHKDDDPDDDEEFLEHQVQTLTEVVKRDTVVFYNSERYRLYFAINPTKYKVTLNTVNEDGMEVENVYYDNIIHLSIFKGSTELFSRDFRKPQYEKKVPAQFLTQSILNDMEYEKTDAQGFHVNASLCTPGNASCYRVEHVISFDGKLTTNLVEY